MTVQKIPVWIDTDPGQDDVIALALAGGSSYFDLVGVSATFGNSSLYNSTKNALRFLYAIGRSDVPVYQGAAGPVVGETKDASHIHGSSGLAGDSLLPHVPDLKAKDSKDFFPKLYEEILSHNGELSIVAIGPLTDMANFFKAYPKTKRLIKCLSIMGGGFYRFNRNGNTEFNIFADPQAANEVLSDPELADKIALAPLDITEQVILTKEHYQRIVKAQNIESATNFRAMVSMLFDEYYKVGVNVEGFKGQPVHDPVSVAFLLQLYGVVRELQFKYVHRKVKVLESGAFEFSDDEKGFRVVTDVSVTAFWEQIVDAYDCIDGVSPLNLITREQLESKHID